MGSLPVPVEEAEGPSPHNIYLQDLQAPGPFQGIVIFVQVQEYHVKDLLPHVRNLLPRFI